MPTLLDGDETGIFTAARLLRSGRPVVIPTETVYGLAANALDYDAVAEIFRIKGRPATNPVIVHVHSIEQATGIAAVDERAKLLAVAFWPGPLTLVMNAREILATNVTAGGTTVGVRMPNHPIALQLLKACCLPLAAPSANRSEGVSPTDTENVIRALGDDSPPVLDGGPCTVGIESTVLDITQETPVLLRPGSVSLDQIAAALQCKVRIGGQFAVERSPGQMRRHYAPATPTTLATLGDFKNLPLANSALLYYSELALAESQFAAAIRLSESPAEYARMMYSALSRLDQAAVDLIVIEEPPDTPHWAAIRDRLKRASAPKS